MIWEDAIVGTIVRQSGYALRSSRDWWLQQGQPSKKAAAKESYDKKCAERGILFKKTENQWAKGFEIAWDNGSISKCLTYMVDAAEERWLFDVGGRGMCVCDTVDLAKHNEFTESDWLSLALLQRGHERTFGGGAAAETRIRRI